MSIINFSDYLARRKAQSSNKPASFLEDQLYGTEKYDEDTPFADIPEEDAGELIDDTDYEPSIDKDAERDLRHKALGLAKEIYEEGLPEGIEKFPLREQLSVRAYVLDSCISDLRIQLNEDQKFAAQYYLFDQAAAGFLKTLETYTGTTYQPGCYSDVYSASAQENEKSYAEACLKAQYIELSPMFTLADLSDGPDDSYDQLIITDLDALERKIKDIDDKASGKIHISDESLKNELRNTYAVTRFNDDAKRLTIYLHTKEEYDEKRRRLMEKNNTDEADSSVVLDAWIEEHPDEASSLPFK